MVVHGRVKTGVPLAINGIFGNLGVAAAALLTGYPGFLTRSRSEGAQRPGATRRTRVRARSRTGSSQYVEPPGRVQRSRCRSVRVRSREMVRNIVTFSVMASTLPVIAGVHASRDIGALFVTLAVAASGIFAAVMLLPRTRTIGGRTSTA